MQLRRQSLIAALGLGTWRRKRGARTKEDESMNAFTKSLVTVLIARTLAVGFSAAAHARDRGINQPGAAGNVGGPGIGKDPGINQPGAAGNVGGPGVGKDPGINQPGKAGNRRRVP